MKVGAQVFALPTLLSLLAFGGGAQAVVGQQDVEGRLHVGNGGQSWFVDRQLREPVEVTLASVDESTCRSATLSVDASGSGEVSPGLPFFAWDGQRCQALLYWTLSGEIGRQHLVLETMGDRAIVEARARRGARVFFGAAYTPRQDSFRQVSSGDLVEDVDSNAAFRPVVGVDFPLWPSLDRVRMAVATGARELDEFFYFGASLLQAGVFGPQQEAASVDVHLGFQLSRRQIVVPGEACGSSPCTKSDLRFGGVALMLTVDGSSAFRGLAGAILP